MVRVENGLRRIKSFVVFDLETSGLHPRTRITEIGLVGALREHISDACTSNTALPRVLNKINLCVYPSRLIDPGAYDVTGLDNVLLQEQKPFDCDVYNILESFLRRLPPPVCLIAHNGDRFDFPVLQAELKRLNKVLPDDLLCADSLKCFRELFSGKNCKSPAVNDCDKHGNSTIEPLPTVLPQSIVEGNNLPNLNSSSELGIYPLDGTEFEDEYDGVLFSILDDIEKNSSIVEGIATLQSLVDNSGDDANQGVDAVMFRMPYESSHSDNPVRQQQTETTPRTSCVLNDNINKELTSPSTSQIQQKNETTPKTGISRINSRIINKKAAVTVENVETPLCKKRVVKDSANGVRKRLNFDTPADEVCARPVSFKLSDVYQFLHGSEPPNAHTADSDAINLLRCIVSVGDAFLEWTDNNAKCLSEVLPRK